jgi:hypothetical protein
MWNTFVDLQRKGLPQVQRHHRPHSQRSLVWIDEPDADAHNVL